MRREVRFGHKSIKTLHFPLGMDKTRPSHSTASARFSSPTPCFPVLQTGSSQEKQGSLLQLFHVSDILMLKLFSASHAGQVPHCNSPGTARSTQITAGRFMQTLRRAERQHWAAFRSPSYFRKVLNTIFNARCRGAGVLFGDFYAFS